MGTVGEFEFLLDVTLNNQDGDLTGTVTVSDDPDEPVGIGTGTYTLTGTHEPSSGRVAIAPEDWTVSPNFEIELLGFVGSYDPETGALDGMLGDYATGLDNVLLAGPASLVLESGDGEALEPGDGARSLPTGEVVFTGTNVCTSASREVRSELVFDGVGSVTGTVSFGDLTLAEDTHTFEVTGVHNPSTGGITLMPGVYTAIGTNSFLTFYLDGAFDPSDGSFNAAGRTNVGPCPMDGGWSTTLVE